MKKFTEIDEAVKKTPTKKTKTVEKATPKKTVKAPTKETTKTIKKASTKTPAKSPAKKVEPTPAKKPATKATTPIKTSKKIETPKKVTPKTSTKKVEPKVEPKKKEVKAPTKATMKKASSKPSGNTGAAKDKVEIRKAEKRMNYISVADLEKYKKITNKFTCQEAKDVVDWLIVNNSSYIHMLDPEGTAPNAMGKFYDAGIPSDPKLKELYRCIGTCVKEGRMYEIPCFQTEKQFNAIINKKISPDSVYMGDLVSTVDGKDICDGGKPTPEVEKNRARVFKKYEKLVYKIVHQNYGKSSTPFEDLFMAGCEGLTSAMNTFGRPKARDPKTHKWVYRELNEIDASKTFLEYAQMWILNHINGEHANSHLVRNPLSQQRAERETQGFNNKSTTVSGDKIVGHDNEGNGKSLFDYIQNSEEDNNGLDHESLMKLWSNIYAKLDSVFGKDVTKIFYMIHGLNGYSNTDKNGKKIKAKEIGAKFGIKPTTLSMQMSKITDYMKHDPIMRGALARALEMTQECKQDEWDRNDQVDEEYSTGGLIISDDL